MQLHIPKPCTASWENMTPEGQGRHCAACAKQVFDFTSMSDEQVLQFLASAPGPLCGRMTRGQMQRDLAPPAAMAPSSEVRRAFGRRFFHYGLGALFALLAGATGCDRRRLLGKVEVPPAQVRADTDAWVTTGVVLRLPQADTLCLTVVSDRGDVPIAQARVRIKNGKGAATTGEHRNSLATSDEHGKANLLFPEGVNTVTLEVSAPGYASSTFSIHRPGFPGDYPHIRVKVELEEVLMGDTINPAALQRIKPG